MTNRTTQTRADLTATRAANYERALAAEPRLRAVVTVVDALTELVRPTDRMCSGCVWEKIVKPMVLPLIGWGRGHLPHQAKDPDPRPPGLYLIRASEIPWPERTGADTETEKWLRSVGAWDAFTSTLLVRLDRADPANGHGIGRRVRGNGDR